MQSFSYQALSAEIPTLVKTEYGYAVQKTRSGLSTWLVVSGKYAGSTLSQHKQRLLRPIRASAGYGSELTGTLNANLRSLHIPDFASREQQVLITLTTLLRMLSIESDSNFADNTLTFEEWLTKAISTSGG